MKMDIDIKQKWVEALRSGSYEQGQNQLRLNNEYCCLGVLCDIVDDGKWSGPDSDGAYRYEAGAYDESYGLLPEEIRFRCGISHKAMRHLVDMNDAGDSFTEIADYIEKKL